MVGKYQCGKICDGIIPAGVVGEYWIPSLISAYGSADAVRRIYVPGTMVDTQGYFYAACYLGFDKDGPILNLYRYNLNGTLDGTRNANIAPWTHFLPDTITTTPNLKNSTETERFKDHIHNTLQLAIAQDIDFYDNRFMVGAYGPPYRYRSKGKDLFDGCFGVQKIYKGFGSAPSCSYYVDPIPPSESVPSYFRKGAMSFPSLNFVRVPKLRLNNDYVITNGQPNFSFFRFKYNGDVYGGLYQIAQTGDDNGAHSIYYIRGNQHFLTNEESDDHTPIAGCGIGVCTGFVTNTTTNPPPRRITMTPRVLKIGSYLYSTFMCDGCFFNLYQQSLSDLGPIYKTYVSHSHDMENWKDNQQKDTPYPYDFCILEKDGTPSTPSSPDSTTEDTRKIWCLFCFGCGNYGKLTASFGWSNTQCNYDSTKIVGVLRSQYLPIGNAGNFTPIGDWIQNMIYITEATRGQNKTTVAGGDDLWQIHFNSHKMVAYHAASGRNYFIFAYCYPNKKKQLYLTYAPYYVDTEHKVRLLTKTQLSSGDWGDSFGDFTSCSRIISMNLVGEHLWISFMNADNTEFHYFHCLAKDLVGE